MMDKKNVFRDISFYISILALVISALGYWLARQDSSYLTELENRRLIVEILRELKLVEEEFSGMKLSDPNNLSEEEILLLNYYQVLSKLLADKVVDEPDLFSWAQCTHENSVRLRMRPSVNSTQVGGIGNDEWVVVLGEYSYNEDDVWYFVVSTWQKKIGWAYKHFKKSE